MAFIGPFQAIRPQALKAKSFSAAAWDADHAVASPTIGKKTDEEAGISYLHLLNPQRFINYSLSKEEHYGLARKGLADALKKNILLCEEKPAIYIYRQIKTGHSFTGIIALASIDEYRKEVIKKHELTRRDKCQQIETYFKEVGINGSPVLLTYPSKPAIKVLIEEWIEKAPDYHFQSPDEQEHMLWVVDENTEHRKLAKVFEEIDAIYIADGHHRCASYDFLNQPEFMACFMADDEIKIHPFHRYLRHLNGFSTEEFLKKLEHIGKLKKLPFSKRVEVHGVINFYIDNNWYSLHIDKKYYKNSNPKDNLDVSILEKTIFEDILQLYDVHTGTDIQYIGGDKAVEELLEPVLAGNMKILFTLFPVSSQELFHISDEKLSMPPKSTWIEPKMRSGLLIHSF